MRHRLILCLLLLSLALVGAARAQDSADSRLRVIHAAADAPAVDIYIDGTLAAADVEFGDATPHFRLPAGTHEVEAQAAGEVVVTQDVDLLAELTFSVLIQDEDSEVVGRVYEDILDSLPPGISRLAAIHAISSADPVDILRTDGAPLMVMLTFGQASGTINIPTGAYDLVIAPQGGSVDSAIGEVGEINMQSNVLYTLVIAPGDDGAAAFVYPTPVNGDSGTVLARFVNAASEAVDVYAGDMLIVPGLQAEGMSAHIPLPEGEHDISLRESGAAPDSDAVFTDSISLDDAAQTIAIMGEGDDLSLLTIADDVDGLSSGMARLQVLNVSADEVSLETSSGTALADGLESGEASAAVDVSPGEYTVGDWSGSLYGGTLTTLLIFGDDAIAAASTDIDVRLDSVPGAAVEVATAAEGGTAQAASANAIILVREAPNRAAPTLAGLNIDAIEAIIGRNEAGDWLQVSYTAPEGTVTGWVLTANLEGAGLIDSADVAQLPVVGGESAVAEQAPATDGIQAEVELPAANASVNLPFTVSGYALDPGAAENIGIGVDLVRVHEGTSCDGSILGEAVPALPRQDISNSMNLDARFVNSGFSVSVAAAPNGTVTLTTCAHQTATDTFIPIDTRAVSVQGGQPAAPPAQATPQVLQPTVQAPPAQATAVAPDAQATPVQEQPTVEPPSAAPPGAQPNARPTKPGIYPPVEIVFGVVNLNQGVNLQCREYPSTDARSLGLIPNGTELVVVGLPAPRDETGDIGRTDAITIEGVPDFSALSDENTNVGDLDPALLASVDVDTMWLNVDWILPDNTAFGCWVAAQYVQIDYRNQRIDELIEYLELVNARNFDLVPYNVPGGPRDPDVTVNPASVSAPTPLAADRIVASVNVNTGVNLQLRRTPGVDGESLALVPGGSQLFVLGVTEVPVTGNVGEPTVPEWLLVDFEQPNGVTVRGYISAEFVVLSLGGRLVTLEDVPAVSEVLPGGVVNPDGSIQ